MIDIENISSSAADEEAPIELIAGPDLSPGECESLRTIGLLPVNRAFIKTPAVEELLHNAGNVTFYTPAEAENHPEAA